VAFFSRRATLSFIRMDIFSIDAIFLRSILSPSSGALFRPDCDGRCSGPRHSYVVLRVFIPAEALCFYPKPRTPDHRAEIRGLTDPLLCSDRRHPLTELRRCFPLKSSGVQGEVSVSGGLSCLRSKNLYFFLLLIFFCFALLI